MSRVSWEIYLTNLKSVGVTVLELLTFNAQKFRGSRDPVHAPFRKNFKGSCPDCPWEHLWGSRPDCPWEHVCQILKSVALTVLELFHVLHFHALELGPSFSCLAFSCLAIWSFIFMSCIFTPRYFAGPSFSCPAFSAPPSVALTVLELLAFNVQKFRGSRDPGHAHFRDCSQNIFFGMLRGSCIPNLVKIGPELSSVNYGQHCELSSQC